MQEPGETAGKPAGGQTELQSPLQEAENIDAEDDDVQHKEAEHETDEPDKTDEPDEQNKKDSVKHPNGQTKPKPKPKPKPIQKKGVEATHDIECLSQTDHILQRGAMYLGKMGIVDIQGSSLSIEGTGIKAISYRTTCTPALQKLLDEALTNATDNALVDAEQTHIKVSICRDSGRIKVSNNGKGIPIVPFSTDDSRWVPDIIFGEFRTSSKFDDSKENTTGGMNGVGIKLVNVWSKEFSVVCVDSVHKKKFTKTWRNNMSEASEALVQRCTNKKGMTEIEFLPDYERLHMTLPLETGIVQYLSSRVFDSCAVTDAKIDVFLNDKKLNIKNFVAYAQLSLEDGGTMAKDNVINGGGACDVFQIAVSDGCAYRSVGFVNGVRCSSGTHMDYVVKKLAELLTQRLKQKCKRHDVSIKPSSVREHMGIILNVKIPNARFTSQEKSVLDTAVKDFKFTWTPSKSFSERVSQSSLIDQAMTQMSNSDEKKASKAMKQKVISHKYEPALQIGKRRGSRAAECTLIVTEGDSAKATAICGLEVVGRDLYGVFPLRGKVLNVRNTVMPKIMENEEIKSLINIIGLELGTTYTEETVKQQLNYQQIAIFADQDHDGAHIAGLIINFFDSMFPTLLSACPQYICRFATPIIRALHSKEQYDFFSMTEFDNWKAMLSDREEKKLKIKYYKGLGTSTSKEAKGYFSEWDKHCIHLLHSGQPCSEAMKLFFEAGLTDERKKMLSEENIEKRYVDYACASTTITNFLFHEVIQFSMYDIKRSIPHSVDGLKPGTRKILYGFRKKNYATTEIKVAQAGAAVAECTHYHHGEVSLIESIVAMAQSYCGTNNLPLLEGIGQFGSRHNNRGTHSAARYIFTRMTDYVDLIFPPDDDHVLEWTFDDNDRTEPVHYVPVVPMVLVNSSFGIGTGFSSFVPCFDIFEIFDAIDVFLREGEDALRTLKFTPHYNGWNGTVASAGPNQFTLHGIMQMEKTSIHIRELPPQLWTDDYVEKIHKKFVTDGKIQKIINHSTEHAVHLELCFGKDELLQTFIKEYGGSGGSDPDEAAEGCHDGAAAVTKALENALKLKTHLNLNNMYMFDANERLVKFGSVADIFLNHAHRRLELNERKRVHMITELEHKKRVLQNKIRFITLTTDGTIALDEFESVEDISTRLQEEGFLELDASFAYLLDLTFKQRLKSNRDKLVRDSAALDHELERMRASTPRSMWSADLDALRVHLEKRKAQEERCADEAAAVKKRALEAGIVEKPGRGSASQSKKQIKKQKKNGVVNL